MAVRLCPFLCELVNTLACCAQPRVIPRWRWLSPAMRGAIMPSSLIPSVPQAGRAAGQLPSA